MMLNRNNSAIRQAIEAAKVSVRRATGSLRQAAGIPTDPHLLIYNRLTPADFDLIMHKYGPEETARYIREMETRRMKGGKR